GQPREHAAWRGRTGGDRPQPAVAERGDPDAAGPIDGYVVGCGERTAVGEGPAWRDDDERSLMLVGDQDGAPRIGRGVDRTTEPPRDHAHTAPVGAEAQHRAARRVGDQQLAAARVAADAVDAFLPRQRPQRVEHRLHAAPLDADDAVAALLGDDDGTAGQGDDTFGYGEAAGERGDAPADEPLHRPAGEVAPDQDAPRVRGDVVGLSADHGHDLHGRRQRYGRGT